MISPQLFVAVLLVGYGILGVFHIIVGAARAKKGVETHYGMPAVLWGLFLIGVAIAGWLL
jgi:hypothetical protein